MTLELSFFWLIVGIKTSNKLFDYSKMQIDPQVDERLPYGVAFNFWMMLDYIQKFSSKEK